MKKVGHVELGREQQLLVFLCCTPPWEAALVDLLFLIVRCHGAHSHGQQARDRILRACVVMGASI
jgi:hypothetical protein